MENRLYAYADDSTLLAVVRKPADRPAVAASRDLARIQVWCNHWCMVRNPNKTKDLVVIRSRTVYPLHGDLVLFWGFHLCWAQPRHSWREVWQQAHLRRPRAWYCLPCLSMNWYFEFGETFLRGQLCVASLLLCICSPNPLVLFSGVGSLLLNIIFSFSSASCIRWPCRLCPDRTFLSLCHGRNVAALCML